MPDISDVDENPDRVRLGDSIGFLLTRVGSRSHRLFADAVAGHRVKVSEYGLLASLSVRESMSLSELAESSGIDARNLSPLVEGLVGRGHLRRGSSSADRRVTLISLTPSGRDVLRHAHSDAVHAEDELLTRIADQDVVTLRRILVQLLEDDRA